MKPPAAYFATALSALCHVVASPLQAREVFNPPVLDPNTETMWVIGTTRNVTWCVHLLVICPIMGVYLYQ